MDATTLNTFWDQYSLFLQYKLLRNWWHSFTHPSIQSCGLPLISTSIFSPNLFNNCQHFNNFNIFVSVWRIRRKRRAMSCTRPATTERLFRDTQRPSVSSFLQFYVIMSANHHSIFLTHAWWCLNLSTFYSSLCKIQRYLTNWFGFTYGL